MAERRGDHVTRRAAEVSPCSARFVYVRLRTAIDVRLPTYPREDIYTLEDGQPLNAPGEIFLAQFPFGDVPGTAGAKDFRRPAQD